MTELKWQPGWPTHCWACLRTTLDYAEDGAATCRVCGAVTRPQGANTAPTDVLAAAAVHSGSSPVSTEPPPPPSPLQLVPPRDVTVGISLELFGIALAIAGLATHWLISAVGAFLAFIGFVLHIGRF